MQDWWQASATRASSSRRSRSGWASTRPTSATSTTTRSRRASRRTRRRRAAPGRDGEPSICEFFACPDDQATLENFTYGDTPDRGGLAAARARGLRGRGRLRPGRERAVDAARRAAARRSARRSPTSSSTATCARATPFYAGYKIKPLSDLDAVCAALDAARGAFLRACSRTATVGTHLADARSRSRPPTTSARPRARIASALDWLAAQGHVELQPSDVRQRYRIERRPDEPRRARRRARRALRGARARPRSSACAMPLALAVLAGCRTNALVGYFGEQRAEPCGHCSFCLDGEAPPLPPAAPVPPLPAGVDEAELATLVAEHPRRAGDGAPAGALPVRHHEPRDVAGQAREAPALRAPRRSALRRRARLAGARGGLSGFSCPVRGSARGARGALRGSAPRRSCPRSTA